MVFRTYGSLVCLLLLMQASVSQAPPKINSDLSDLQLRAEQALGRGDPATAIAIVQKGLNLQPDWKEGLWTLGWTLFQTNQYEAARGIFVKLVRLDQSKGASWLLLGLCEFQARDYGMSLDDLLRGRALGIPVSLGITSRVRYSTAIALLLAERYERAQQFFEEAGKENEHTDQILIAWGLAAMRMPVDPQHAHDVFSPEQLDMLRSVGEALFRASSHQYDETARIYADLFRRYPAAAKLHHSYGFLLIRLGGDLSGAETQFRAEMAVDPNSVLARLGLAFTNLERGETSESIRFAREAVRLDPESASANLLLGQALLRTDQISEGAAILEVARNLEPENMQIHFLLARAYGKLKRTAEADLERGEFLRLKRMDDALSLPGHQYPTSAGESDAHQTKSPNELQLR